MAKEYRPLKELQDAIRNNGSVMHEGRSITRLEDLPSAADLAQSGEDLDKAEADLEVEELRLKQRHDAIRRRRKQLSEKPEVDAAPTKQDVEPAKLEAAANNNASVGRQIVDKGDTTQAGRKVIDSGEAKK